MIKKIKKISLYYLLLIIIIKKPNIEINNINKEIKIGIYYLFVKDNNTSGLNYLVYNQIDDINTLTIEEQLKSQNISSEYLPLYKKYNWLSNNIRHHRKCSGLSGSLSLSLASLFKNNLAKETEAINFTIFATGKLDEDNCQIKDIGGLHEKLYAIEKFLEEQPKLKNSCLLALSKNQKDEYDVTMKINKELEKPLFNTIPYIKTIFIEKLHHHLPIITHHINNNAKKFYEYSDSREYTINENIKKKIGSIQNKMINQTVLNYYENNNKKNKKKHKLMIYEYLMNYHHIDESLFIPHKNKYLNIPEHFIKNKNLDYNILLSLYLKNIQKCKDNEEYIYNNKKYIEFLELQTQKYIELYREYIEYLESKTQTYRENLEELRERYEKNIVSSKDEIQTYRKTNIVLSLLLFTSFIFNIRSYFDK